MNWIRGFDRIFLIAAIPVFFLSGYVAWAVSGMPKWKPNPHYQIWNEKREIGHAKWKARVYETKEYQDNLLLSHLGGYPGMGKEIGKAPPKYLPLETHQRMIITAAAAPLISLLWIGLLCGTSRLMRLIGRFIMDGFKQ